MERFFDERFIERLHFIKRFWIYGNGLAAQYAYEGICKLGLEKHFLGFLCKEPDSCNSVFCGKRISQIDQCEKEDLIIIMANPKYKIESRLEQVGLYNWIYMDPSYLLFYQEYKKDRINGILEQNKDKIDLVYSLLADDYSRRLYRAILSYRLSPQVEVLQQYCEENQYFGNSIIENASGVIVDCGAYTGDTLKRFMNQVNGDYLYYACEADLDNCSRINEYICKENIQNVKVIQRAIWNKQDKLSFYENPDSLIERVSGRIITDGSHYVEADMIDHIVEGYYADLITMDIEGAELNDLIGAKKTIQNSHPKLAISAYHDIHHLWEVPLLIKNLNQNYKLYFRHHRWNMDDTVCYAICDAV